jgi:hypothetical protein
MARHEVDREDLMTDATALRQRIELVMDGESEPIVAGVKSNGYVSVYFGADPAYHFDAAGGLRRAFVEGLLYRSQGNTLARLSRTRTAQTVDLARHDLEPAELEHFLASMETRLGHLQAALERGAVKITRQVPENENLIIRLIVEIAKGRQKKLSRALTKR